MISMTLREGLAPISTETGNSSCGHWLVMTVTKKGISIGTPIGKVGKIVGRILLVCEMIMGVLVRMDCFEPATYSLTHSFLIQFLFSLFFSMGTAAVGATSKASAAAAATTTTIQLQLSAAATTELSATRRRIQVAIQSQRSILGPWD